jgi:hypothetical protein
MTGRASAEHRKRLQTLLGDEDKKGWVHHVADLDGDDGKVNTLELNRPISAVSRLDRLKPVGGSGMPGSRFLLETFERQLTARRPYQDSPLSYLDAFHTSWSVLGDLDRLEWVDWTEMHGEIEFWFRNVTVGSTALVTIEVSAAATPGLTGNIEVRSSAAGPHIFPVKGYADHTLDLIVRPKKPWAVLVSMEPKEQIGYLSFRSIKYQTLY